MIENYEVITSWLTAIGTVSAVFVALFGRYIHQWTHKPRIKMEYSGENTPCLELIKTEAVSSEKCEELKIRIKVINCGRSSANSALIYCSSYLCQKKEKKKSNLLGKTHHVNTFYEVNEFLPIQIDSCKNYHSKNVVPKLLYYYDVASIKKMDGMSKNDGTGREKQFYKLYLCGEDTMMLPTGEYIVPITFYASSDISTTLYMRINWDEDKFNMQSKSGIAIDTINKFHYYKYLKSKKC